MRVNKSTYEEVIAIITRRDRISMEGAKEIVIEALRGAAEAMRNDEDPEEPWTDITGLEPDYLYNMII